MKILLRHLVASLAVMSASVYAAYPEQPIRVVVPFPPGGGTDIVARMVLEQVSQEMGQPVIVENKAGAGTQIGTVAVANAKPDGYTLLFASSAFSVTPSLRDNANYDPLRSFAPIGIVAKHPFVFVVNPTLPVRTAGELVDYAKQNPGKVSYASVGNGSSQHLGMEWLKHVAGIDMLHVPYNGSAPAMADLLGGQVSLMLNGISPTLGHIKSGKLHAIATDNAERVAILNEVPTLRESGYPGFQLTTWSGLLAPAGTPKEALVRLEQVLARVMSSPELNAKLTAMGLQPYYQTAAQSAEFLAKDVAEWRKLITETNTKAEGS